MFSPEQEKSSPTAVVLEVQQDRPVPVRAAGLP